MRRDGDVFALALISNTVNHGSLVVNVHCLCADLLPPQPFIYHP